MTNSEKLDKINKIIRDELQYVIEQKKKTIPFDEWKYLKNQEGYLFRLHTIIEGSVSGERNIH